MQSKLKRKTEPERVSELLGLPEEINDAPLLRAQVAKGLPAASVENILNVMHSQPTVTLVPERAFRRAKDEKKNLSAVKSQTIYDLARAYVAVDGFYNGNGPLIMRFLEKPHQELGGARPLAVAISSPAGSDAVIGLLRKQDET